MTLFALVDCNNFFASCERVFRPDLIGKPVVVLSNNDGCVIARSNEAKALGIGMGAPVHQVRHLLKHAHVFSANFPLYGDLSNRIIGILRQMSPRVEAYSIDEAFLSLDGYPEPGAHAEFIRRTVSQWTHIPVSIGMGSTKTLSKVAVEFAKKSPAGILYLKEESEIEKVLEKTPLKDVWGVGRSYGERLSNRGIKNAKQLRDMDEKWVYKHFGVALCRTVQELRGVSCMGLESSLPLKKGIICSRSFGEQVFELKPLLEAVSTYASRASEKLRAQHLAARSLTVFIRTNRFRSWEPQYHNSTLLHLPVPTDCTHELITYAKLGVRHIFQEGYGYHKAGVMLNELVSENQRQIGLFDQQDRNKLSALMRTLDNINLAWGQDTVKYAAEGLEKCWKMKQVKRSNRYTTCWDEFQVVSAALSRRN